MVRTAPTADELITAQVSPDEFWAEYIAQRKPALLHGHPQDASWKASPAWTDNAYLVQRVNAGGGAPSVMVERREQRSERFGRGVKQRMAFADVVAALEAGNDSLYLTTQEVGTAPDGHPHLFTTPVAQLAADIPLAPALMGHLVPQSINLWMGASPEGTSSGLHHDFHDNLYTLLSGTKTFRLWPPAAAPRMYTHGEVVWTHPNGRIVYRGQGDVLADGTDASEVQRWEERTAAEAAVAEAEAAALEAALEEATGMDSGGVDGLADDWDSCSDGDAGTSDASNGTFTTGSAGTKTVQPEPEPPSFSRVDLSLPDAQLHRRFPLFPGRDAALVVTVRAGDMLYLPAGWFHEVASRSEPGGKPHLALNYWFHPPDHLDPSRKGFLKPYTSPYLPTLWEQRRHMYQVQAAPAGVANGKATSGGTGGCTAPQAETHSNGVRSAPDASTSGSAGSGARGAKRHAGSAAEALWAAADELVGGRGDTAAAAASAGGCGGAAGAGGHRAVGRARKRRALGVHWGEGVGNPPNKYRVSTTRAGSASGSPAVVPSGPELGRGRHAGGPWGSSAEEDDDDSDDDYIPHGLVQASSDSPDDASTAAAAHAAGRAAGPPRSSASPAREMPAALEPGSDSDNEDAVGGVLRQEIEEALGKDPGFATMMRQMLAAAMRRYAGGHEGSGSHTRRMPRPPSGRRHHLFVALRRRRHK